MLGVPVPAKGLYTVYVCTHAHLRANMHDQTNARICEMHIKINTCMYACIVCALVYMYDSGLAWVCVCDAVFMCTCVLLVFVFVYTSRVQLFLCLHSQTDTCAVCSSDIASYEPCVVRHCPPTLLYRVVPGHRNHLNDPASEFLSTHSWSQNPACMCCFYKPLKNYHPDSGFLHSP